MKKIMLALVLLLCVSASGVFALGLGVQGDFNVGENTDAGLSASIKFDSIPFYFAVKTSFTNDYFALGLTADNWILNDTFIQEPFKWFIGWGLYTNMVIADPFGISVGGRIPVGLNAFFANGFVEPYIQVAPSIGITFLPDLHFPDWSVPISLGVRFWLTDRHN